MLGDADQVYPGTAYFTSEDGWMTRKSFYNWFKSVFLKHIDTSQPNLLIFDGHLSHMSIDLIKLARANNVHLFKLPPHTSHILQPLDVCVFFPFKVLWDRFLTEWSRQNIGRRLSKRELCNLVGKTYRAMDWEDLLKSGFKKTGLFDMDHPERVNKDAIPDSKFDSEKLARYKKFIASEQAQSTNSPGTEAVNNSAPEIPQPEVPATPQSQVSSLNVSPVCTEPCTMPQQQSRNVNNQANNIGSTVFNQISAEALQKLPSDGFALVPVSVLQQALQCSGITPIVFNSTVPATVTNSESASIPIEVSF